MKGSKRIILTVFILIALALGVVFFYVNYSENAGNESGYREKSEHEALANIGPYGKNISYTENIGDLSVNMKAERLFARKSTIFGFSTVLKKHMVAENLTITVYDRGKRLYRCKKNKVVIPYNMDVIEVDNPYTIFPKSMRKVSLLRIDRKEQTIVITDQYGEKQLHSRRNIPALNIP